MVHLATSPVEVTGQASDRGGTHEHTAVSRRELRVGSRTDFNGFNCLTRRRKIKEERPPLAAAAVQREL